MILGAGIYQVPLIRKAKDLQLETIVCSIPGDYPGIPLADRFIPADTRDYKRIYEIASQEQIDGICTAGSDVAVISVGYVCEKLHLNGISFSAAQMATDKLHMKETFRVRKVSTADFRKICSSDDAKEAARDLGYPLVIKPADSSGSRGVRKISDPEDLDVAFYEALTHSRLPYVLAEAFIDAQEIGVDAFVENGEIRSFLPHTKLTCTTAAGITIPAGHRFPFESSPVILEKLYEQIRLTINALQLDHCAINADVFIKGSDIFIIEIGARSGATCIPELISLYQGFDWYEQLIRSALGEQTDFHPIEYTAVQSGQ